MCLLIHSLPLSLTLTPTHTTHTPKLRETHQFMCDRAQTQTPTSPNFLFCHICPSGDEVDPGEHSIASPSVPLQSWHQRPQSNEFFFHKGLQAQAPRPMGSGPIPGAGEAEASVAPTSPSSMSPRPPSRSTWDGVGRRQILGENNLWSRFPPTPPSPLKGPSLGWVLRPEWGGWQFWAPRGVFLEPRPRASSGCLILA